MDTVRFRTAAAAVTGARHLRAARNGQDAAVAWAGDDAAVVVVGDGCSSGASSEVGARLGASLFARVLAARLVAGATPSDPALWAGVRADVVNAFADLLERMPGDRAALVHDHFLFTIVAAAVTRDAAAVWALGDGTYSFGEQARVLGPFADNQPPYLGYDLLGTPAPVHFEVAPPCCDSIVIATDGACELDGLDELVCDRFVDHPDALRRRLAVLARASERIDWEAGRVVRTPAQLQDDCAVGILRRSVS